ncbi:hypothetical protein IFT59_07110 [Rhizobium sp. CFBP 8752]|uniref:hypothetical protein n=1 Tax=Rhizobium sp. CFBP 8752 TaxID=2775301 RepID=UPI001781D931|nr:hypothetical protein [Rhizobium sp. CFBP 8752]MBD8663020.1 hypothetical protein [Rhizobium sp. CFBP 8752]
MPVQLSLDVIAEEAVAAPQDVDLAQSVLNACGGDPLVAIRELLADADFLRDQLYIAARVVSSAMARGWKPKYERPTL